MRGCSLLSGWGGSRDHCCLPFPFTECGHRSGVTCLPALHYLYTFSGDGCRSSVPQRGCTARRRPFRGVVVSIRGVSQPTSLSQEIKDLPLEWAVIVEPSAVAARPHLPPLAPSASSTEPMNHVKEEGRLGSLYQ